MLHFTHGLQCVDCLTCYPLTQQRVVRTEVLSCTYTAFASLLQSAGQWEGGETGSNQKPGCQSQRPSSYHLNLILLPRPKVSQGKSLNRVHAQCASVFKSCGSYQRTAQSSPSSYLDEYNPITTNRKLKVKLGFDITKSTITEYSCCCHYPVSWNRVNSVYICHKIQHHL